MLEKFLLDSDPFLLARTTSSAPGTIAYSTPPELYDSCPELRGDSPFPSPEHSDHPVDYDIPDIWMDSNGVKHFRCRQCGKGKCPRISRCSILSLLPQFLFPSSLILPDISATLYRYQGTSIQLQLSSSDTSSTGKPDSLCLPETWVQSPLLKEVGCDAAHS